MNTKRLARIIMIIIVAGSLFSMSFGFYLVLITLYEPIGFMFWVGIFLSLGAIGYVSLPMAFADVIEAFLEKKMQKFLNNKRVKPLKPRNPWIEAPKVERREEKDKKIPEIWEKQ